MSDDDQVTAAGTSPAASGPAGAHFEGQVGAYYLLSLLAGAEPRGLPGTSIDRVEFQRAPEGRPLDDVVVHAHDAVGQSAVLEIQVKRGLAFTPSDDEFKTVVRQIAAVSQRRAFSTSRYEMAIAVAKTSRKIDGAYQDVLTWARQLESADTFMSRIHRPGSANDDMRRFVRTFAANLHETGAANNDDAVWQLLRRLQILTFDFASHGSAFEHLARERAARVLHPDAASQAEVLWSNLVELAIRIAAAGGARTRDNLIQDLRSFRFAGERRFATARAALAEASRAALLDIGDRIGNVMLTRHEHLTRIRSALETSRYVEIRGDAGVGKSGLLKHLAKQTADEGHAVVLSPGRTIPRGWIEMRSVIGLEGTAHELLADLAGSGGAALYVDNLDLVADEERRTVVDLVRAASEVPGMAVIATARRDFGVDEPSWLPVDAMERLGRAERIVLEELTETEVDELRHAAPRLAALLGDSHPARQVTRNLFRLSRLVSQGEDEPTPRSEADMAEQWWRTADGRIDSGHRNRTRLLRALGEWALTRIDPMDARGHPASAVNALIRSDTLRDLGGDRVVFRHDVFREWAIGCLLNSDPSLSGSFALDRPAPAAAARGVELAARFALERNGEATAWLALLDGFSGRGTHASWRRSVVLALARSEAAPELLNRISAALLADSATLLRELIRTVMAVDAVPASSLLAAAGIDPAQLPAGFDLPSGPSWQRLILYLLTLGDQVPWAVRPDVVDLYSMWLTATLARDALAPYLVHWLHRWLIELETGAVLRDRRDELKEVDTRNFLSNLRSTFLLFCSRKPELAQGYLRSLRARRRDDEVIRGILKFRGALAQAAPAELAELTASALIPDDRPEKRNRSIPFEEPFDYVDLQFLPASPNQGPFFELLTHAPAHGLALIRRLIDHAMTFHTKGREPGGDAFAILFPDGERVFPWTRSYTWSRDASGAASSVESGLLALEAWAHKRIENGEDFNRVLADVLGQPGAPAAYLLVAVDLLLSHWPKSREAAIPFLGCPELLCIDRQRHLHDNLTLPDFFGLKATQKEPIGPVSNDSLRQRPSRFQPLEHLVGSYAFGPSDQRDRLAQLLRGAADRLGPPGPQSDLGDPEFMVTYALNLVDPANWREVAIPQSDGSHARGWRYASPAAESRHLEALQDETRERHSDGNMQSQIALAVEDTSKSSPAFARAAAQWAQKASTAPSDDADSSWMREQAIVAAAMLVHRDGDADLRTAFQEWTQEVFRQVLQGKEEPVHRFRGGVRFNPVAIAVVGMIHAMKERASAESQRALLNMGSRPAAAHALGAAGITLTAIDERLSRALLRCAFTACIQPHRQWDQPEDELARRQEVGRERVRAAVDAEVMWLSGHGPEPTWPTFPSERTRRRLRRRIGRTLDDDSEASPVADEDYIDHHGAALWLTQARRTIEPSTAPWLLDVVRVYADWTTAANGGGLSDDEEISHAPGEWNLAYFDLLAHCLPLVTSLDIDTLALVPIASLPDEPFFDVVTQFIRSVDDVYFNGDGLETSEAVRIRSRLTDRLTSSRGWRWVAGRTDGSIEVHIGPAIAVFFFNDYGYFQPGKSYLLPKGLDRIEPFTPILDQLVQSAPGLFVAVMALNLLEVSPRPEHVPFAVRSANAWLAAFPSAKEFWVDQGIGRRVCGLIDAAWRLQPTILQVGSALRSDVDGVLAALVRLGVSEAARLEKALAAVP